MSDFITNAELRIEAERLVEENEELRANVRMLEERGDASSYEEGYSDGFDKGEEAVVQQIDAIIDEHWSSDEAMKSIRRWIADFWKERES
jgi:flagellar biosynthesis/type III secretory pathway protein FliH